MPESLTPEQLDLRDRVNAFMTDEVSPLEESIDANEPVPEEARRQVRERSRAAGIYGLTQPVEYGGTYSGAVALAIGREAVAAAHSRLSGEVFGPGPGVLHAAGGDLRDRYLMPLMRGENCEEPGPSPRARLRGSLAGRPGQSGMARRW